MWDVIKDYIIWILGAVFATIQIFQEFRKRRTLTAILSIVAVIVFIYFGIDQINRNNREKESHAKQMTAMQQALEEIKVAKVRDSLNRIADSTKDAQFQKDLATKFNIMRDSASNKPIQSTYNTHINKAENVHIGPN